MAFMRRDVNLGLLLLIIVSIASFTGFSVYYQSTFQNVSMEYQNKLEQLSKVTKDLGLEKQKLNETYSLRVKAEEDRNTLDARYREVNDENGNLKKDKASLQLEVASTKSQLGQKSAELEATKTLLTQIQAQLAAAQNEISSLKVTVDKLDSKLKTICTDYKALNNGNDHSKC